MTTTRELIGPGVSTRFVARLGGSGSLPVIGSFGENDQREIFVTDHVGGRIFRVVRVGRQT